MSDLTITYTNTRMDKISFHVQHQLTSPLYHAVIVLCFLIIFLVQLATDPFPVAFLESLVAYVIAWLLQIVFIAIFCWSKNDRSVLTEHVIELRQEGLVEETRYNHTLHYWFGLLKVVERLGFIAVYVTPTMAYIIPPQAFTAHDVRSAFLARIREEIKNAVEPTV